MLSGTLPARRIGHSHRRYRLGNAAIIIQDKNTHSPDCGSYAKNRKTGALFRLGAGESLLLVGLGSGLSADALIDAFAQKLQITITSEVIDAFARDMVERGFLEQIEQGAQEDHVVIEGASGTGQTPSGQNFPRQATGIFSEDRDKAGDLLSYDAPFDDSFNDDMDDDLCEADFLEDGFAETVFDKPKAGAEAHQHPAAPRGPANAKITRRSPRFTQTQSAPVRVMAIRLFNPTGLLRILNFLFGWLAIGVSWLILPLAIVALLSVFHRLDEALTTLSAGYANLGLIGLLAMSMLTVNLLTRLVVGAIIQREGGEVPAFGITFLFFVIPRFAVDTTNLFRLDRKGRMRVFSGALKARLAIFTLCTLFWDSSRLGGTGFSEFIALLGQISLLSFLISAFPLLSGEGYRLMTAYFDQPLLRERSLALLFGRGKKSRLPPVEGLRWWMFLLYGLSVLIFSTFIITLVAAYASTALVGRFGGTGAIMFISLIGLMVLWFLVTKSQSKRLHAQIAKQVMAAKVAENQTGPDSRVNARDSQASGRDDGSNRASRQLPVAASPHALVLPGTSLTRPAPTTLGAARPLPGLYAKNTGTRRGVWLRRALLLAVLGAAVYVAFLPYQYDAGGDFTVLPDTRVEVIARVPGELAEVLVNEGDTVQAGDVLARQQGIQERHSLAVATAALAKAEAQLETLQSGATPEEQRVAQEQVFRVTVELPFLETEANRAEELMQRGAIPRAEAESIKNRFEVAKADLRTAQANLEKVQALAQDSEIAASKADIDRLAAEKEYYEQLLKDTEIVAPVSGQVVIEGKEPVRGTYLQTGELLMEIEDHRIAQAEIKLPETDIGLISVGEQVRLKFWARPGEEWIGTVTSIAPVAEPEEFGKVVRVRTRLPNDNGLFRPGMTGFAKIEGPEMRAWEAYTRLFMRFFMVEIWGWIP